jgi:hypothetical protein
VYVTFNQSHPLRFDISCLSGTTGKVVQKCKGRKKEKTESLNKEAFLSDGVDK